MAGFVRNTDRDIVELGSKDAIDDRFATTGDTFDDMLQQAYTNNVGCDQPKCSLFHAGGRLTPNSINHTGNGATTDNIFIVNGPVRLIGLYGIVTAIGAGGVGTDDTMDNLKLELDDGAAQVDLTLANSDLTGNGTVGTVLLKDAEDNVKMTVLEADSVKYHEGPNKKLFEEGIIVPKNGATTYIRASYTGDANTDITINWVIRYTPKTTASTITTV